MKSPSVGISREYLKPCYFRVFFLFLWSGPPQFDCWTSVARINRHFAGMLNSRAIGFANNSENKVLLNSERIVFPSHLTQSKDAPF